VTGIVYILYYDRRNYSDNQTDVYMAVSRDGGTRFENFRISDTPFIPYSTAFFGHYLGVSAHNDKVFAAWSRQDNGQNSLWGAMVDTGSSQVESITKGPVNLEQNIPNPFNESTFISFKLTDPGPVTLKVIDLFGNTMATIMSAQETSAGKHTVHFQPDQYHLVPGVYYFTLITRNETVARKMVFGR
jgi:hypothetical protein